MSGRVYARSVLRIGKSTLAVSLPKAWAKARGLRPGDVLFVAETPDGALLIRTSKPGEERRSKALLEIKEGEKGAIERLLIALYEAGYDVIRVVGKPSLSEEARREIRRVLRRLSGLEIIEESYEYMLLQCFLNPKALNVERTLERMEAIVRLMLQDLRRCALEREPSLAKPIAERDDDLDRFFFLLCRQVNLALRVPSIAPELGLEDSTLAMPVLSYGKVLERMGDVLASMAIYVSSTHRLPSREDLSVMEEGFRRAVRTFKLGDEASMRAVSRIYDEYASRGDICQDVLKMLMCNFLSLCLDVIEVYAEMKAIRWPLLG